MGAAAALDAFMCLLSAQRGLIPPTLNLEEPDPECDLDYVPGRARPARPRIMLSTSMGFGGCNGGLMRAPEVRRLGLLTGRPTPGEGASVLTLERPDRPGDRFRRATRECLL